MDDVDFIKCTCYLMHAYTYIREHIYMYTCTHTYTYACLASMRHIHHPRHRADRAKT